MAGFSFLLNTLLLRYFGNQVIISYSPILEELAKTLFSYYLGADILLTHIVFGVLEGGYDWLNKKSEDRGLLAAFLSIIGHGLFGGLTVGIFYVSGSIFLGIVIAVCGHLIWNMTLVRFYA